MGSNPSPTSGRFRPRGVLLVSTSVNGAGRRLWPMQDLVLFSSEALAERFHARGSSQGPRFGIDALAELGAQAGWLLLAELGTKAGLIL